MPFFALLLLLAPLNLLGQSFMQDDYIPYYLQSRLREDITTEQNLLSPWIALRTQPRYWIKQFQQSPQLLSLKGIFPQLDLELNSYQKRPLIALDYRLSSFAEQDISLQGIQRWDNVEASLYGNFNSNQRIVDQNKDGLSDQALQEKFLLENRWEVGMKDFSSSNSIQYLKQGQIWGDTAFVPAVSRFQNSAQWGIAKRIKRLLTRSVNSLKLRRKDRLNFNLELLDQEEAKQISNRRYSASEQGIRGKLSYTYFLSNQIDAFIMGLHLGRRRIKEQLDRQIWQRESSFIAGIIGYESSFGKILKLSSRLNLAYHNLERLIAAPNLKFDVRMNESLNAGLFVGYGQRFRNLLSEREHLLYNYRTVQVEDYLQADKAVSYQLHLQYKKWISLGHLEILSLAQVQWTQVFYLQKNQVDIESSPSEVRFYNSSDKAQSNYLECLLNLQIPQPSLSLQLAYRRQIIRETIGGAYRESLLRVPHQLFANIAYDLQFKYKTWLRIESQFFWNSTQRLADLRAKDQQNEQLSLRSPSTYRWNLQLHFPVYNWIKKRRKWTQFTFYLAVDNILLSKQLGGIASVQNPLDTSFDASMLYNTFLGRRYYTGLNFRW